MDPILIGKKIKEAYPQYASRDDAELGTSYLKKYGGAISSVRSGQLKLTDLPADQRAGVGLGVSAVEPEQVDPMEAIAQAMKQGGSKFIDKGKDKDARSAIALEIAKMGGVAKYREALPLRDLVTDKENEDLDATTDLKIDVARSIPGFQEETPGGTGPFAQFIPDYLRSPEGRDKVSNVERIRSTYQKVISGLVVSDREAERLKAFLPAKSKTETQNREDLQRLQNGIDISLQLFEKAKREGLTPNEAYDKYGAETLKKYGINLTGSRTPTQTSGSRFTIEAIE